MIDLIDLDTKKIYDKLSHDIKHLINDFKYTCDVIGFIYSFTFLSCDIYSKTLLKQCPISIHMCIGMNKIYNIVYKFLNFLLLNNNINKNIDVLHTVATVYHSSYSVKPWYILELIRDDNFKFIFELLNTDDNLKSSYRLKLLESFSKGISLKDFNSRNLKTVNNIDNMLKLFSNFNYFKLGIEVYKNNILDWLNYPAVYKTNKLYTIFKHNKSSVIDEFKKNIEKYVMKRKDFNFIKELIKDTNIIAVIQVFKIFNLNKIVHNCKDKPFLYSCIECNKLIKTSFCKDIDLFNVVYISNCIRYRHELFKYDTLVEKYTKYFIKVFKINTILKYDLIEYIIKFINLYDFNKKNIKDKYYYTLKYINN